MDDRTFKYAAIALAILLAFGLGLCTRRIIPDVPAPAPQMQPVFVSAAAELKHKRLLKKHGLDLQVAVILEDPLGRYYIRDGRRYKFQ